MYTTAQVIETLGPRKNCMSCKRKDTQTAFSFGLSYCKATDECLEDAMNYINKWCPTYWVDGWMIDINEDCGASESPRPCNSF